MLSATDHLEQARHNARLLSELRQDSGRYPDWQITVAFYTALHLVEAVFAQSGKPKDSPRNHQTRNLRVARQLSEIWGHYGTLYVASRRARYDCPAFAGEDAERYLQRDYEPIRAHLCDALGVTL